jgi:carbon-monoxide dehydrogenase small subunit
VQAQADVLIIEVRQHGKLHPTRGFREYHGLQCGFCIPNDMSALDCPAQPGPDDHEIREWLEELRRCTGYQLLFAPSVPLRHEKLKRIACTSSTITVPLTSK